MLKELKKLPDFYLSKILSSFVEKEEIPLLKAPPFPWEAFSKKLAELLGKEAFSLSLQKISWKSLEEMKEGMEEKVFACSLAPLAGKAYWLIDKKAKPLFSSFLFPKERVVPSSETIQEGFYQFLLLEVFNLLQQEEAFQGLSFKKEEESAFPEKALCLDLKISCEKTFCWGRLALSPEFRKNWNLHFSQQASLYTKELLDNLEGIFSLQVGKIFLTFDQWKQIKKGDFLFLDRGAIDLEKQSALATLSFEENPLLQAKIEQNRIEWMDFAFYQEEVIPMEKEEGFSEVPEEENKEIAEEILKEEKEEEVPESEPLPPKALASLKESSSPLKEVPLTLTVEIARLRMPLKKVLELQPGNFLELPLSLSQGVDLCLNGKKIARAELLELGEALGIRILEIGK